MAMGNKTTAGWLAAIAGAALLAGATGAASAGSPPYSWRQDRAYSTDPRPGPVRMADGRICERMCPHDSMPCDPINFKIADGRCNGRMSSPR